MKQITRKTSTLEIQPRGWCLQPRFSVSPSFSVRSHWCVHMPLLSRLHIVVENHPTSLVVPVHRGAVPLKTSDMLPSKWSTGVDCYSSQHRWQQAKVHLVSANSHTLCFLNKAQLKHPQRELSRHGLCLSCAHSHFITVYFAPLPWSLGENGFRSELTRRNGTIYKQQASRENGPFQSNERAKEMSLRIAEKDV